MTLTRNQMNERAGSLSGELKAARELHAQCEADQAAQDKLADIARQATEKALANIARLETERADLAEAMKQEILRVGEPTATEPANAFDAFSRYTNGDDSRVNTAFEDATNP